MAANPPSATKQATPTLTCPECGKTFTRAAALGAHRKMTHGIAGSSKTAANTRGSKRTSSRRTTRAAAATRSTRRSGTTPTNGSNTTVDRDALLRALFPNGIPPRQQLMGELNDWLNEAERLASSR